MPLIFADLGDLVGLAIFIVSGLIWAVGQIQAKGAPKGQGPRPPGADALQRQLQDFLNQVNVNQKPNEQKREVPSEGKQTQPRKSNGKPKRKQVAAPQSAAVGTTNQNRPARRLEPQEQPGQASNSPGAKGELGAGVRDHVSTFMNAHNAPQQIANRIGHQVQDEVQNLNESVKHHLGESKTFALPSLQLSQSPINELISKTGGLRQVVLWQEILGPPKALKKRLR